MRHVILLRAICLMLLRYVMHAYIDISCLRYLLLITLRRAPLRYFSLMPDIFDTLLIYA